MSLGVIVGRFQIDELHEGHRRLIDKVFERHTRVMICLGVTVVKMSERDPLDFQTRALMIRHSYPNAVIVPQADNPSDHLWSDKLDELIHDLFPTESNVTLYGAKDSFIPRYKGKHRTEYVDTIVRKSATERRVEIKDMAENSVEFRRGAIYSVMNKFPVAYPVVDVAVMRHKDPPLVLLCQKKYDVPGKFGFVGGFVNPGETLEEAARREVLEETDAEIGNITYLGSSVIPDWRYKERKDQMLSAFFVADYLHGGPVRAKDDIVRVEWIPLQMALGDNDDESMLMTSHRRLGELLRRHMKEKKNNV